MFWIVLGVVFVVAGCVFHTIAASALRLRMYSIVTAFLALGDIEFVCGILLILLHVR